MTTPLVRNIFAYFILTVLLRCSPYALAENVKYTPVTSEVVQTRLQRYAKKNPERESIIKQMFSEAGCDGQQLSEQPVKGSKSPNVVCLLPGSSDRVIVVGAHFDHVSEGDGVVDNWSGAALLPSLYQALKDEPRQHTFLFVAFTDEEKGEVGSKSFVHQMTPDEVKKTHAMVNMDTLGLTPTKVWTSRSDKNLVQLLGQVAQSLQLPASAYNVENVGTTDSEQFAARKIPSITVHSLTQETWDAQILHTSKDTISKIKFDDYYQSYRLLAAYLAYIDAALSRAAAQPTKE